jgi:hypothetical protein
MKISNLYKSKNILFNSKYSSLIILDCNSCKWLNFVDLLNLENSDENFDLLFNDTESTFIFYPNLNLEINDYLYNLKPVCEIFNESSQLILATNKSAIHLNSMEDGLYKVRFRINDHVIIKFIKIINNFSENKSSKT